MSGWGLTARQERALLNSPDEVIFQAWQRGDAAEISEDTLERISFVLGIYKTLRILFSSEQRANTWPGKPNRDFHGRSALELMLDGELSRVRRYLEAQCQ
jgi:hypothetical protein